MAITFEKQYKYIMDRLPKEDNDLLEKIATNNRAFAMGRIFEGKASSQESLGLYNLFIQNMIIIDLLSRIYNMQNEAYLEEHDERMERLKKKEQERIAEQARIEKEEARLQQDREKAEELRREAEQRAKEEFMKRMYETTDVSSLNSAKDILNWVKTGNGGEYNTPEIVSELEKIVRREMLYGNNKEAAIELLQKSK